MKDIESFREYCLSKIGVTEELPFGPDVLVYKVAGKMFATSSLSSENWQINLKCEPEKAIELREIYSAIIPGWHMNKMHWNTIYPEDNSISSLLLKELTDHSYQLVVKGLTRSKQKELGIE